MKQNVKKLLGMVMRPWKSYVHRLKIQERFVIQLKNQTVVRQPSSQWTLYLIY